MRKIIIYPILFSLSFALSLASSNPNEVSVYDVYRTLLVLAVLSIISIFVFRYIFRSYSKGGLISLLAIIIGLSYGHIRDAIANSSVISISSSSGLILSLLAVFLFMVVSVLVFISHKDFHESILSLNICSICLVAIIIGTYVWRGNYATFSNVGEDVTGMSIIDSSPNIYYIILDTYSNNDFLKKDHGFDNSEFTNFLESKGFSVMSNSNSNYYKTFWSLTSSLSMEYIDELTDGSYESGQKLLGMASDSRVSRLLKSIGYKYIYVSTGYFESKIGNYATVYTATNLPYLNYFERSFVQTTMLSTLVSSYLDISRREGINYAFDKLISLELDECPTFVYSHIICPHGPYIFDRNGKDVEKGNYIDQLIYVNNRITDVIDNILLKDSNAIIILQGDHGGPKSELDEAGIRSEILNAYHFPNNEKGVVYDTISPVNTFRVIFNRYFGTNFDVLEDRTLNKR